MVIVSVPRQQTGVASGMNANIRTIGGSIGSAVMAGVITAHLGASGYPLERGYTIGFLLLAGGMLCATAAAAYLPEVRRQPTDSPSPTPTTPSPGSSPRPRPLRSPAGAQDHPRAPEGARARSSRRDVAPTRHPERAGQR